MYPREPSQHEVGELNAEQDVDMTLDDGMEAPETAFSDADESTDRFVDNFKKRQFPRFDRWVIMILYQERAYALFRVGLLSPISTRSDINPLLSFHTIITRARSIDLM